MRRLTRVLALAFATPFAVVLAVHLGGEGAGLAAAFVQAACVGVLATAGGAPGAGWLAAAWLAAATALGAMHSAAAGLLAHAGAFHALLYGMLLFYFARSLGPGREALVTSVARQVNPSFGPSMERYTGGVTWLWCGVFALELAISAVLKLTRPDAWPAFVHGWHTAPLALVALGELALRHHRFPGRATGLADTVRGVRRMLRPAPPDTSRTRG